MNAELRTNCHAVGRGIEVAGGELPGSGLGDAPFCTVIFARGAKFNVAGFEAILHYFAQRESEGERKTCNEVQPFVAEGESDETIMGTNLPQDAPFAR